MPSNTFAYRATIGLIWALALWHSWICRGLFVDGFGFLIQIVTFEWFFDFYPPRLYAMIAAQIPVMIGVIMGATDLHLLARLLSLGFFGLPTILYSLALYRARNDSVVLASVIAAIALVFLPVSFFIVGEYNTLYALAILVSVTLATSERLRVSEGLALSGLALFSLRVYEAMVYIGPFLVVMMLWRIWRAWRREPSGGRLVATLSHLLAALLFAWATWIARDSIVHPFSDLLAMHLDDTLQQARNFWQNMQFDFVFAAALVIIGWALVRPADLVTPRPYFWATILLAILALTPLLAFTHTLVRPLAKSQYVSRVMGGMVTCAIVSFIWFYRSDLHSRLKAPIVLRQEQAARRLLRLACLMSLAVLPSDIFLSLTWVDFIEATRADVVGRSGIIPFEDSKLSRYPEILLVENWVLSTQSLAVRANDHSGIIVPPKGFDEWVPFLLQEPPNLGRFYWRD